nr:uncharacterized protein LOC123753981 isoform X2 [Procambarus clarkii]
MMTRKRTAGRGTETVLSGDNCNSRGHHNTADSVLYSEQDNSSPMVSDGLSPVLKRKSHLSRALRTLSNTPLSKVMTEPVLCHSSAASPIIGRRKLPAHTDNVTNITQKLSSLVSMDCNKENEKVFNVNSNKRRALLFPFGKSNNTENARNEGNSPQVQYDTVPKKINTKENIVSDKENIFSPKESRRPIRKSNRINNTKENIVSDKENILSPKESRLPIRKSKRIKKVSGSVVQLMQSGRKTKIARKNLLEGEVEHLDKDASTPIDIAESKRGKSEPEDDILQENQEQKAARTRKRMTPEKSTNPIAKRVNIVSAKKDENGKKTVSVQQRVENSSAERRSSTSPVNNKNASILTERVMNRPIRNQKASPQPKVQEEKSKEPTTKKKEINTLHLALQKSTRASTNKSASRKVTANIVTTKSQSSKQKFIKPVATKCSAQSSKSAVSPKLSQTSSKTPLNMRVPPTSKAAVTPPVAQSSDKSLHKKVILGKQKQKLPVWAEAKCSTKTPGKRKSLRVLNKDVFEFMYDVSEEEVKKRRVVKPRKKQVNKKPKPRTKLTLLTTDPNWEIQFPSDILKSVNTSTARKEPLFSTISKDCNVRSYSDPSGNNVSCNNMSDDSTRDSVSCNNRSDSTRDSVSCNNRSDSTRDSVSCNDRNDDSARGSVFSEDNCESVVSEDNCDDFYSHDTDNVTEEFEFETASSFVASNQVTSKAVPMTSVSVFPTPVISKHISKYIGGSSTPRAENVLSLTSSVESTDEQNPKTLKEDIAVCFGFENEEEEVEESSLNLSPVRRSGMQSCLEITGTSDVVDLENHPPNQPSRFSWGSLQPGRQSNVTATNSSSVLVHGRSDFQSSLSSTMQSDKSVSKSTVGKSDKRKNLKENNSGQVEIRKSNRSKQCVQPAICENEDSDAEDANASVFFDEVTDQHIKSQLNNPAHRDDNTNMPTNFLVKNTEHVSPEKSFSEPPRKSYDRSILEEIRRKFISEHAGASMSESEEDVELKQTSKRKKKKTLKSNITLKKKKKKKKKDAADLSLTMDDSSFSEKKNISKKEQALDEWALSINSQFNEVESCDLIID